MIRLLNISKNYRTRFGNRYVLDNLSLSINPGEKIGILGRNGAGKSTLLRIIAGTEKPTSGSIERSMSVSWPMGISGGLQGTISGIDNVKFICRLYGLDIEESIEHVRQITELGKYLREPVANYSSGMRTKLALAISIALDFDCFLIDESLSFGDKKFQEKYRTEIEKKHSESAMVLVSHVESQIRKLTNKIYVLSNGNLRYFKYPVNAFSYYNELIKNSSIELD